MKGGSLLVICAFGLVVVSSLDWQTNWNNLLSSIANQHSGGDGKDGGTCDHEDRKNHAIALLHEWVTHKHYDAVEKLYHDIYHKDLSAARRKRQWHHYSSNFDEAFIHSNRDPDYRHVEGYIMINMNQACRVEIMRWIENLAHRHNPHAATTAKPTHAHVHTTAKPTHAHVRTTAKPTPVHVRTTEVYKTHVPTTRASLTLTPSTQATKITVKTTCDAVTFVTALARGTILTNAKAGMCTDGTRSRPEALIMDSCMAPVVAEWSEGVKVMGNCDRIPDYTPIATFDFGTYVEDGTDIAGIITECTPNGFKIAMQLCGHPVDVYEVTSGHPNPRQNADNYHVINW
ncbi:uncharacterized protein [Mytilus edulis]|uniref:uncharacterized protein isoform X2 n=1 Tax=Mytilus edulis TaxID=6550 RepID=UPI0039EE97E9